MRILTIAQFLPTPDRASGDLRFFTLLSLIAKEHDVTLTTLCQSDQIEELGEEKYNSYVAALKAQGIAVADRLWPRLRDENFDVILFEFYQPAVHLLDEVRFVQPSARIIVDSVDVHFRRYAAKATLSGAQSDLEFAERIKKEELGIYKRADVVIVVTEDDRQTLLTHSPELQISVIPNVHQIHPPMSPREARSSSMIFVGGFKHEPNVDAIIYFCREIMPLVRARIPSVHLSIVGSHPPDEVLSLASESIEVTGYVPDTAPYLRHSAVSIAPLRYGAGMKGKIGEAMSHGLPVVTTSIGAEGFGLTPGADVLVSDTAAGFASHVVNLLQDQRLHDTIRINGWEFMRTHYSVDAVEKLCQVFLAEVRATPVRHLPWLDKVQRSARYFYDRNIAWRFR